MDPRTAYTSLILQFPPVAAATAAGIAGFLGAGVPGVGLARLRAGGLAVDDGVRWAVAGGGAGVVFVALLAWLLVQAAGLDRRQRMRVAVAIGLGAVAAPLAAALGILIGTVFGGDQSLADATRELGAVAWHLWPLVVAPLALAAAHGLAASKVPPSP